ncbi:cell wall-binding repeat-containing protein [Herbiconiux sp. CPCC 205716]|uniref:Cell wall-binding repeat-containing protein n=1 Tax=Herbiconiux gentiana TaxID=2970912 RepID=A0ABT2GEE0_9MICO|nr:cell wall-binding repeat-containing protein [Herbiconiux gentiana]MCS5713239.1 cell wall-binding repeat-containing protein [Herbiconiux gentiana]
MIQISPSPATRRAPLVALMTVAAIAIGSVFATPLTASATPATTPVPAGTPDVGLTYCAPAIVELGSAVDFDASDSEQTSGFTVTISEGSLPDGLTIRPVTGLAYRISGTAAKLGAFRYTMHFTNGIHSGDRTCAVDVVPVGSKVERIAGDDRYATGLAVAGRVDPDTAPLVYVASGENYPDALSAAAIAAQRGAPLILTPRSSIPESVYGAIYKYAPRDIVVVGGTNAVSTSVETLLRAIPSVSSITRIGGADRFEVSRNLITHPTFGAKPSAAVSVVTGNRFPDALSATPPSGRDTIPVLLVNGDASSLTANEKSLLTTREVTSATLFGGEDTVSTGIANDIKKIAATVNRIDGSDRFVTSANVAKSAYPGHIDTVYLATGENFPDALSGGVLAAIEKAPILLTRRTCMASEVADEVRALTPKRIVLLGGQNVLDATLENLPVCS